MYIGDGVLHKLCGDHHLHCGIERWILSRLVQYNNNYIDEEYLPGLRI